MNLKDTLLKAGLKVNEDNIRRKEFGDVCGEKHSGKRQRCNQ